MKIHEKNIMHMLNKVPLYELRIDPLLETLMILKTQTKPSCFYI